jgi:tetratricopeptide (TPR) repeat protein
MNYKRDEMKFWNKKSSKCWNTGDHNGYDLCENIRAYMHKIRMPHLSLIEAIVSGEVEELLCLQSEVGPADSFFSHVQAVAVASTMHTLEDAEKRYSEELLEDKPVVAALRKKALQDFYTMEDVDVGDDSDVPLVDHLLETASPAKVDGFCLYKWGSSPHLASIAAKKKHTHPRFFVDYFNIRQCTKNDFATDRLVDAIDTIGSTVVELGADFRDESALLKRVFCVLELFATVKTKGKLLVCGPALEDATTTKELAAMAGEAECKEVMDSRSSRTRSAEAEAEIKTYIKRTIGFNRLDRVVLGAILASCVGGVESAFDEMEDCGASLLLAGGCMLADVGDYKGAKIQLEMALAKGEAAYGEGAFETEETVYMIGQCSLRPFHGDGRGWFERSYRMCEEKHCKEHATTARSLVGIGRMDKRESCYEKSLECFNLAIARIQAADCPSDYTHTHADALMEIGDLYIDDLSRQIFWPSTEGSSNDSDEEGQCQEEGYRKGLEWCERSLRIRETKYGPDHALAADTLDTMATAYEYLSDGAECRLDSPIDSLAEKALALHLRVLGIQERAKGPLSSEVGRSCKSIGRGYESKAYRSYDPLMNITSHPRHMDRVFGRQQQAQLYSEAAGYFKRAVEAMEYTLGSTCTQIPGCLGELKEVLDQMDPGAAITKECRRFLEEAREKGQRVKGEDEDSTEEDEIRRLRDLEEKWENQRSEEERFEAIDSRLRSLTLQHFEEMECTSEQAATLCNSVGRAHFSAGQHSEAAGWFKRAIEVIELTMEPTDLEAIEEIEGCWHSLEMAIDGMEANFLRMEAETDLDLFSATLSDDTDLLMQAMMQATATKDFLVSSQNRVRNATRQAVEELRRREQGRRGCAVA